MRLIDADALKEEICDEYLRISKRINITPILKLIRDAPTVERELFTDKEKRIFLCAMRREEQVCEEIDDEFGDYRYQPEDSLVRICHEIKRKVMDAIWY